MPGIDYDINFNHGKPFIIITFVIECAIPSILLFGKAFAASDPTKQIWAVSQKPCCKKFPHRYYGNTLTESDPTSLVGITFPQSWLLSIVGWFTLSIF